MHTVLLLLPDFALILLGAAIRRWMHLGDHFWSGVEKLVYFILFPALLVNAIMRTRLDLGAAVPLLVTAFAAAATSINNLGPGLGEVAVHFGTLPPSAVWICSFAMILGRLEVFTVLVLLTPAFWRE